MIPYSKQIVSLGPFPFCLIACHGSVLVKIRRKPLCIYFYTQGLIAYEKRLDYVFSLCL